VSSCFKGYFKVMENNKFTQALVCFDFLIGLRKKMGVASRASLNAILIFACAQFFITSSSWADKKTASAIGSKSWLGCQSGFESSPERFVSRLHPQIEAYVAKAWSEYKFSKVYVSFNRGDTIDSLTENQYQRSTQDNYHQNVTIQMRDRYTVNTILDLATRI
jgi:hypothetical protein